MDFHNFYSSTNIIRTIKLRMGCDGHVVRMVKIRNARTILDGNPQGKILLGRRGNNNIKENLKRIEYESVDWINLAQYTKQWQLL
jgi:hypothetical protein